MKFFGLRFGFIERKILMEALSRLGGGHAWIEVVMHVGCMHMERTRRNL